MTKTFARTDYDIYIGEAPCFAVAEHKGRTCKHDTYRYIYVSVAKIDFQTQRREQVSSRPRLSYFFFEFTDGWTGYVYFELIDGLPQGMHGRDDRGQGKLDYELCYEVPPEVFIWIKRAGIWVTEWQE